MYHVCDPERFCCLFLLPQSSVGPQPDSTVPNPGSMTFGTAQRLPKPGKDGVPGPGQYQTELCTRNSPSSSAFAYLQQQLAMQACREVPGG